MSSAREYMQEKHEAIKEELQQVYGGKAKEYGQSRRDNGQLFPPTGMWYSELLLKQMQMSQENIKIEEEAIRQLEAEVLLHEVVLRTPYQMPRTPGKYIKSPIPDNSARERLYMEIGKATARKRIAEDMLAALKTVKPASAVYMERLASLFKEKNALVKVLFEEHGVLVSEW
jgi:hypothetical protein